MKLKFGAVAITSHIYLSIVRNRSINREIKGTLKLSINGSTGTCLLLERMVRTDARLLEFERHHFLYNNGFLKVQSTDEELRTQWR